jgi:UDP-N-acetylglucosamine diphosphorylase / glucose-1-phosphate thymidylyltransferase / UDP-N-acetylgalactosamine diphosphorylase / glucosamine-1-phosphate N-acetyltransferase / galactosamine-1-phosphate N-acetyltransferase
MTLKISVPDYIASFAQSPLAQLSTRIPWALTAQSVSFVRQLLAQCPASDYILNDEIAVHRSATVESGAVLKGPLIVGAQCFVAAGAYLRGGNWIDTHCTFGPGAELKSSFVFSGTKLAHFNFVGDSILGAGCNLEAGSVVCNYRNERSDPFIRVRHGRDLHTLAVDKFGVLMGDGCRIGANAVIAPGALMVKHSVLPRAALLDQEL